MTMLKKKVRDLEPLNLGANTYIVGYDTHAGKTGLVAASSIRRAVPWFGRRWSKALTTPVGQPIGDYDLGQELAYELGLGGYLVQNNHQRVKLNHQNHLLLENGAVADLSGGAGHYQWGWNVPIYYQWYEDDHYEYETISLGGPRKGFWNYHIPVGSRSCAGYATMDRTNTKLVSYVNSTAQFRGGNNDSAHDETYKSQLCKPATNLDISTFRTAARQNGTLWFANERVMQYVTAMLKRIILGTRDIQAAFNSVEDSNDLHQGGTGVGIDQPNDWSGHFGYYPYIRLDVGLDQGDKLGILSTTIDEAGVSKTIGNIPCFYGLKNDYKYLTCMCENMLLQCNADKSQSLFISNDIDGSLMSLTSVSNLTKIATGPVAESAGWQYPWTYTMKNLAFFPSAELGGSSSTRFADGYYNPAQTSGLRGAALLGGADNAGHAGSLCLGGSSAVSVADAHRGAFLCEYAEAFTTEPVWVVED